MSTIKNMGNNVIIHRTGRTIEIVDLSPMMRDVQLCVKGPMSPVNTNSVDIAPQSGISTPSTLSDNWKLGFDGWFGLKLIESWETEFPS